MTTTRREFLRRTGALTLGAAGVPLLGCPAADTVPQVIATDFTGYDGVGLAALVRSGDATPLELVDDVLRRVDQVNGSLNAVLTGLFDPEAARQRAQGALGAGPLSGVPTMLKNLTSWAGAPIDSGSRLMAKAIELGITPPPQTSPLVAAMERTGMIITGLTNSPEMGLIDTTEPILHGATRNPWNTEYTAGGSSGGTGAAVAAGIVPFAHGNDGGGSIRIPASHNGIFGLKPTRARELGSNSGPLSIANDLCLSRSVRDTAAFLSVAENKNIPGMPAIGYVEGASKERLRIALMMQPFTGTPHPEVEAGTLAAAELCRELGHEVTEVGLPFDGAEFVDAFIGFWAAGTLEYPELVKEWLGNDAKPEDFLEPWTLGLVRMATERTPSACVDRAQEVFPRVSQQMETLFGDYDVLLSPVLSQPPYKIGEHDPSVEFDELMDRVLDVVGYTPLQNAVGMPGMSVPLHWTADQLPVGIQFSAWRGEEARLLALAYELEEARPWADRRPPIFASAG